MNQPITVGTFAEQLLQQVDDLADHVPNLDLLRQLEVAEEHLERLATSRRPMLLPPNVESFQALCSQKAKELLGQLRCAKSVVAAHSKTVT